MSLVSLLLTIASCATVISFQYSIKTTYLEAFKCSPKITTCNASLYHISYGLDIDDVATFYSVNNSQIKPITRGTKQDYLITVPCSCKNTNVLDGYFYDTTYKVKPNDTFVNINNVTYSGQAWPINKGLDIDEDLTIHLPCGCSEKSDSQIVVTYTVQRSDTPWSISTLLNATFDGKVSMNEVLAQNPSFIDVTWLLYIPRELNGLPSKGKGRVSLSSPRPSPKPSFTNSPIGLLLGRGSASNPWPPPRPIVYIGREFGRTHVD
ncbi:hypothetical protein Fmac_001385 [Flemingia macrophylla]|uniref:LysM domain-containing protein n=1 Tax=Flemingia macrophylla TaxID=520843 RepID=A0ABD1NGX9_9FABA